MIVKEDHATRENSIAQESPETRFPALTQTSIWPALSSKGREIFLPSGVPYWASRARAEADINATIGSALDEEGEFLHLPSMTKGLHPDFLARFKARVLDYSAVPGAPGIRDIWKKRLAAAFPKLADHLPLPVVTSGITHSLHIAGLLFINPGETLVTYEKYWENYDQIYERILGIRIASAPLFQDRKRLNTDSIRDAAMEALEREGKATILLNFPQNQTGYSPTPEEVKDLAAKIHGLAKENPANPITVLLDDAYEGFVYDDNAFAKSIVEELFDSALPNFVIAKLDGISKVMLAYGLRVSFMTVLGTSKTGQPFAQEQNKISQELQSKIAGTVRGEISNASSLSQAVAEYAFTAGDPQAELPERINLLRERYEIMRREIAKLEERFGDGVIKVTPFNSGFFCYFDLRPDIDAQKFAEYLLKHKKIGIVPATRKKDGKILWNGIRVAFCSVPKTQIPTLLKDIYDAAHEIAV